MFFIQLLTPKPLRHRLCHHLGTGSEHSWQYSSSSRRSGRRWALPRRPDTASKSRRIYSNQCFLSCWAQRKLYKDHECPSLPQKHRQSWWLYHLLYCLLMILANICRVLLRRSSPLLPGLHSQSLHLQVTDYRSNSYRSLHRLSSEP